MKYLTTMEEFEAMKESSKTKLVVLDFTATWCPPCRFIGPIFEKMAEENPGADFFKVDVDEAQDIAAECGIQAMPTFQFYKRGMKIDDMTGADKDKLALKVARHLKD
eukprot:Nitzschia sp. Nitz4//scaffold10_size219509//24283//24709//NITZ4_001399-RA/size219509-augustus-gene-0.262-mRNA-1//-1//CDS//3329532833//5811//frame0